jgi:acetyl-CoA carboxylase biotin carboxyl carrier protein
MDIKKIEKLIVLLKKHGLQSIEVEEKDVGAVKITLPSSGGPIFYPQMGSQSVVGASEVVTSGGNPDKEIHSPFVGTYYEAASPGADPFVKSGQRIQKGDTLCIIEAMKIMNEIEADRDGVIKEVKVRNGQALEFGQLLFTIE